MRKSLFTFCLHTLLGIALSSGVRLRDAVAAPPTIVINEVHYHPGDDSRSGEFVELRNHGSEDVDIGSWLLFGAVEYVFPPSTVVEAGGYLVVASSPAVIQSRHGLDESSVVGPWNGTLSNTAETVKLITAGAYLASFVQYADSSPWPQTPDGLGPSLERRSHLHEECDAWTWAASIVVGGTPGAANSVHAVETVAPPPATDNVDYVLEGEEWRFFRGSESPPATWNAPSFDDSAWETGSAGIGYGDDDDSTVLDDMPGGYLTVYVRTTFEVEDADTVSRLRLRIDYDDGFVAYVNGEEIARSNVDGSAFDDPAPVSHEAGTPEEFFWSPAAELLVDGTNVIAIQGHNSSLESSDFSLSPQLSASVGAGAGPPPAPGTLDPAPRDLVINELATGGDGSGWVELYNSTAATVDAAGRHLRVFPASDGDFVLPPGSDVPAGGFISFTESQLGFELDAIHACVLTTTDGRFIDALNPRTTSADHSTGRYPDGDDNRVVMTDRSRDSANIYDVEQPIVINEVLYHPRDENTGGEWIELFNRTTSDVDISGWAFTRGVSITFAAGTVVPAGGYLVVTRSPTAFEDQYGAIENVGPFTGGLDNAAETLVLRDAMRNVMDRVRYADEGSYPESADGLGPSIELLNPELENRRGPAWRAGEDDGSPGTQNSRHEADPLPVVGGVRHTPAVPTPSQSVHVLASVTDERALTRVRLFWEVDGEGASGSVTMLDDGSGPGGGEGGPGDDGIAANGVYGATIPAQGDGDIIAFWIEAEGHEDAPVLAPAGAPQTSFLYRVQNTPAEDLRPRYRVVMRSADLARLRSRGNGRDDLLDVTLIADGEVLYNRGIRYRGSSARSCDPLSYRIQLDHDVSLHGIKRLNLNGCSSWRQYMGLDFLRRVGMEAPACWFRRLSLNGVDETDWHLRVEAIHTGFLERNFPGDADGNLYRGEGRANLDYRGEEFDPYRGSYNKVTNETQDDYSDVVDLSFRFDDATTSAEDFPTAIEERVDVRQWAFYFAAFAMLGSTENSIVLNNGDDYFLYHRFSDDRWILLPWDLDSCFDEVDQVLFRPTVPQIERFLQHRLYAPEYLCFLGYFLDEAWRVETVNSRIDHLVPLFSAGRIEILRDFALQRRSYVESRLNQTLEISSTSNGIVCDGTLFPSATRVTITGRAPGCETVEVMVNNTAARFDYRAGTWSAGIDVSNIEMIRIVTRNRNGLELGRLELAVDDVVGAPVQDVHVQLPAENSVATTGVGFVEITDPDEDGNVWEVTEGVGSSLNPDGRVLEAPNDGLVRQVGQSHAIYLFRFTTPGSYRGYFRGRGFSRASNTFFRPSEFNRDPDVQTNITQNGSWQWFAGGQYDVTQADVDDERTLELRIGVRELNAQIDAIVLSREPDLRPAQLADLVRSSSAGATGVPRARIDVTPGTTVSLTGDSIDVTLDGAESHDGRCGEDGIAYLWERVSGPDGDSILDPIDQSAVRVRITEGGEFTYRLTVANAVTGNESSAEVTVDVVPTMETPFLRCDANGDGRIGVSDSVFTLLSLFRGNVSADCEAALDCDSDGTTTLGDAIFNLNYVYLGGSRPAAPFPACDTASFTGCRQATCGP